MAKFTVLDERLLGKMTPGQRLAYTRLVNKGTRLEAELKEVAEKQNKLVQGFLESVQDKLDGSDASQGIRINKDGEVYQVFCTCAPCQAELHGLSVSQVVEEMIKAGRIPFDDVHEERARAEAIDKSNKTPKNVLLN